MVTVSTIIELFINKKLPQIMNKKSIEKNSGEESILIAFSIIKNTKNLFSPKNDNLQCVHTLTLIFILWIHIGRYYISPLSINLVGVKKIFSSFVLELISAEKYFWVRTPFPIGTIFIFW
jgi:hypothetical protein